MASRVLFIYRVDRSNPSNSGVIQKLKGQVNATIKLGFEVDYITQDQNKILLNQKPIHKATKLTPSILQQYHWFSTIAPAVLSRFYQVVIIRYGLSTPSFIQFLSKLKNRHPDTKVLLDLPTYPYQQEWKGLKGYLALRMDRLYRHRLYKYIDNILHLGCEEDIWKVPTIRTSNGIEILESSIAESRAIPDLNKDGLNIIAVGKWQFWHGLDRIINGLKPCQNIHLHIIGEGPENQKLIQLTVSLGVQDQVTFYGPLTGSELDEVYEVCHLAVGTLGIHRKGVKIDSSLKHREYCSRGVPFILGARDLDFPPELAFVKYFDGESIVSCEDILSYYDGIKYKETLHINMHKYANEKLSWNSRMASVFDQIEQSDS